MLYPRAGTVVMYHFSSHFIWLATYNCFVLKPFFFRCRSKLHVDGVGIVGLRLREEDEVVLCLVSKRFAVFFLNFRHKLYVISDSQWFVVFHFLSFRFMYFQILNMY